VAARWRTKVFMESASQRLLDDLRLTKIAKTRRIEVIMIAWLNPNSGAE
jgi:hypothetical protein